MTSGRLGVAMSSAQTWVEVYTAPQDGTLSVRCLNQGSTDAKILLALSVLNIPSTEEIIDAGKVPRNGGMVENSGIPVSRGERVCLWAESSTISVRVYGFERSVA